MVLVNLKFDCEAPEGLLVWVVSGDRHTQSYWTSGVAVDNVEVTPGLVSVTAYKRPEMHIVGTIAFRVGDATDHSEQLNTLVEEMTIQPNTVGRRLTRIGAHVQPGLSIQKYMPLRSSRQCDSRPEVTWPVDVCIARGAAQLRPKKVDHAGIATLAERWTSYVTFATLLTSASEAQPDRDALMSVSLSVIGGNYHAEEIDDRGVSGLTAGQADDCDGMSYACVSFWLMLVYNCQEVSRHLSGLPLKLLLWGCARYPAAFVVLGQARNPDNHKTFYHAWAVLVAKPQSMFLPYSELSEDQKKAVEQLGLTPQAWSIGTQLPCRATLWNNLTPTECAALTCLGWNKQMWAATPKLHIEATSPTVCGTNGTVPSETVKAQRKLLRSKGIFNKHKHRLLFCAVRRAPGDSYFDLEELQGPYSTHYLNSKLPYYSWLTTHTEVKRPEIKCCTVKDHAERIKSAPVILRSRQEMQGLRSSADRSYGNVPAYAFGKKNVLTSVDTIPVEASADYVPHLIDLDPTIQWYCWTPTDHSFLDASCGMCSGS